LFITSIPQNKCVVNQLKYVDDISFRGLFGSIRVAFSKKKKRKRKAVSLPTTKYLYLLWTNSFYLYFRFEYGIIEKRTQVIYEISYGITKHLSNTILSRQLCYPSWFTQLPKFSFLLHNIISKENFGNCAINLW
jgi:hypothetical protein